MAAAASTVMDGVVGVMHMVGVMCMSPVMAAMTMAAMSATASVRCHCQRAQRQKATRCQNDKLASGCRHDFSPRVRSCLVLG